MVDVPNEFFVGVQGDDIVFLRSIPQKLKEREALLLAAWIVALADPLQEKFPAVLKAVRDT